MGRRLKIAIFITDNREPDKIYSSGTPSFAVGANSFFDGLAQLPESEVHTLSCTQKPMVSSPEKMAKNIWFHSSNVAKIGWLRTGYQGCIRAVHRKLREIQPDVVHGWGTERECVISGIFSGFPNVVTIQGNMTELAWMAGAPFASYLWLTGRLENFILRGRDLQHIPSALIWVATNPELCRRMGEAAYRKGAIRNTWQDYGDRLLVVYSKLLNSKGASK